tara:strand:+ start:32415 stop:34178 length:1764 start_codon:yes stop_codon:yes gene_type:complete
MIDSFFIEFNKLLKCNESSTRISDCFNILLPNSNKPREYFLKNEEIYVFGDPIVSGQLSDSLLIEKYQNTLNVEEFARSINGSFLLIIYNKFEKKLCIINDRFASCPFYFYKLNEGSIVGSNNFRRLLKYKGNYGININSSTIFEFIYFRKLFGTKTFENEILYMDSASIIHVGVNSVDIHKYWNPDYTNNIDDDGKLIDRLSSVLSKSVDAYTSDNSNCALLLSGGIDSRAILAASNDSLTTCITTAQSKNNEYAVAREVADYFNKQHFYIERPDNIFDKELFDAIDITGGMQVFNECQFLGHKDYFPKDVDTFLTGYGLDILLTDLYLPTIKNTVFDLPVMHSKIMPINGDIIKLFINKSKYRLKTSDPFSIVKDEKKSDLYDYLYSEIEGNINRGTSLGAEGYKLWEYLNTNNLSRHYSYPMIMSIRTFAHCRIPAFDNDLFNISIDMNYKHKLNSNTYLRTLNKLNPGLMNIRNANTNMKAGWSAEQQTYLKYMYYVLDKLGIKDMPRYPGWKDRTWGMPYNIIAKSKKITNLVNKLSASERLMDLGYVDMDKVSRMIEQHHRREHDHAVLINLLLTIDEALK